jgi:hypothetical protein|tara:strand:- start:17345 stop:17638 length:294 start_codon:yes stop_codon:yes gene_type:complete
MTKKGPLGKAEMYYVEGHLGDHEAKQIAQDLDRPVTTVQRHIDKCKKDNPKPMTAGSQMARRDGIVTMTQSASELSDVARTKPKQGRPSCTSRIKDE